MSNTLSMWLGIAFVLLGITAVVLQAWLWNPKYWDEVAKKTNAPKGGLLVHRLVGYAFGIIYLVMMWQMIPRLWEYQVELPARTVMHAVAAIVLGVLLLTKLAILWFFRYFEESMPKLGIGILLCTIVLGVLSIPYAMRAQGIGVDAFTAENLARTRQLLDGLELPDSDKDELVSNDGLSHGRQVLVGPCTRCHDMRTILAKPRTASGWYDVALRMTEKPSVFGEPIDPADVPYVTAYLIAITPEIQESRKLHSDQKREREEMVASMVGQLLGENTASAAEPVPPPVAPPTATPSPTPAAPDPMPAPTKPAEWATSAKIDPSKGNALLGAKCTQCHELDEIDKHGGDDGDGWAKVVRQMVEEGAEIDASDVGVIVPFLAQQHPKK